MRRQITVPSHSCFSYFVLDLLPSATKLRRLCFYRCVSVHRGGGIPACLAAGLQGVCAIPACIAGGIPACLATGLQGVVPGLRGLLQGVPAPGGSAPGGSAPREVSQHVLRQTPPPGRDGYCCGRYASHWNAFLFN